MIHSYFYAEFSDTSFCNAALEGLRILAANSEKNLSTECKTYIGTITQYVGLQNPPIMKENASDLYVIGVNTETWDLVKGCASTNPQALIPYIKTTYTAFIEAFDKKMKRDPQCMQFIEVISKEHPELLIKNVDIVYALINTFNKYYATLSCVNMAQKFPDEIYKNEK